MSNASPRTSIQELGLNDGEELKLYLELIRIIEKDIDEIKAAAMRSGWTSWAMLGSIVGAFLVFLGETRKLQTFPTEQVETVWLAARDLEFVERGETQLKQRRQAVDYYLNNPDRIPKELRDTSDPSKD